MTVSIDVPTEEPLKLVAGNTWTWKRSLSDFMPSDGWTLTYNLFKSDAVILINATDDDDQPAGIA